MSAWRDGLTEDEVRQYWEDGFLVYDDALTAEEVELYRTICASDAVVSNRSQSMYKQETVHLLGLTTMHPALLDLARHPAIVSKIIPLLGPDIQIQHSKLATKPPAKGLGEFPWHQDFAFYPHTNTDLLSVMIMLDDATPENGCMQMVKGSHRLGLLDHSMDGYFVAGCQEPQYWEHASAEQTVQITPKAGGISIHHCLTLHGSPVNLSGKERRGIVISYRADDAYQLADNLFNDTGLMVCGERKELVRCEPATYRLPKRHQPLSKSGTYRPFGTAWNQVGSEVTDY
ncbi:phytanoyl-CoA dioxygenase family protein [Paenibacillus sp. CF384]|uniref:phytanoyl-CoA dioxygenase family protein n=1 Tax=Paenibacillus sp. CF384 TaxID=1884382 RepID=UPI0008996EE1|nr:phytanoyl-CoA dioxygenase family protein [Paenibacillus sp. CF384]SDW65586.1 Phytanoyl-CoA dioxygenase (PhyH) [Paenibacillus sp. CF384]